MTTSLVVMQSTSFCNLDCKYCYLPDRSVRGNMKDEILDHFYRVLFNSDLADHCRIVWHAGEPLASGIEFFQRALEIERARNSQGRRLDHWIQTNGTLIDDRWCDFLHDNDIAVSISLDGPSSIHDLSRIDRQGRGTWDRVHRAIKKLQDRRIRYQILSVLTRDGLAHADDYFSHMLDIGARQVGINIEELNMQTPASSMVVQDQSDFSALEIEYRRFFSKLFEHWKIHHAKIEVRELAQMYHIVNEKVKNPGFRRTSEEHTGLDIINVRKDGGISTFAPELVEDRDGIQDTFVVGNVRDINSLLICSPPIDTEKSTMR